MPIINPTQLVDEFKKSGEFDRLRKELLAQFQRSDAMVPFMARVDDIARQRLASDPKLQYMPQESVHRELMQEMDRYPLVERAVADVRMLSDPAFAESIRSSVRKIIREDRGQSSPSHQDGSKSTTLSHVTNNISSQPKSEKGVSKPELSHDSPQLTTLQPEVDTKSTIQTSPHAHNQQNDSKPPSSGSVKPAPQIESSSSPLTQLSDSALDPPLLPSGAVESSITRPGNNTPGLNSTVLHHSHADPRADESTDDGMDVDTPNAIS